MEDRLDKLEKTVKEGFQQLNDLCLAMLENQMKFDSRLDKVETKVDNIQNTMNSFVKRTVKAEEEIIVIAHRQRNHEDRITELEKKSA